MKRIKFYLAGIVGTAAVALILPAPAAAVPDRPAGEGAEQLRPAVEVVERPVRVPVDDFGDEATQMLVAAALGAVAAAAAGRRRPREQRDGPSTVIDLTESVQL
ncbi:hypothetical protein ACQPZX_25895 [Actinoplanes sp. CA-142083]|uniref:hypothetical protein n=1 Tax=Actinoplanes sp. CA-142083 TaxID=3239903 RepID=UPI003D93EF67